MAGRKNLKSNAERAPEELKAMGAKGGRASGEARRRRKETRALIREVLGMRVKTDADARKALKRMGYDEKTEGAPTVETVMTIAIAAEAMKASLVHARFLYDYAQVPDMRAVLEKERMKAVAEGRSKVDLTVTQADAGVMREVEALMKGEGNRDGEPADGLRVPDPAPGEVREPAGV